MPSPRREEPAAQLLVRLARPDDVPALARIHVRSWQVAYAGVFPDEFLGALRPDARAAIWEQHLADERLSTLVAELAGRQIGFSLLGPERTDQGVEVTNSGLPTGEVWAIYLEPEVWGRGIGRRLLAESERVLADRGFREAVLWVLDSNQRARRFYEACGWQPDGAVKREPIFGQQATEVRYRKPLGNV